MSGYQIVCANGDLEYLIDGEDEDYAWVVVQYFDSNAATGAPMDCSPHRVARVDSVSQKKEGT